jgi:methionyl-tRNA formyltransferase
VLGVDQAGAEIACGEGTIVLGHGQLEGRRPLAAHALATGRSLGVGMCLGS